MNRETAEAARELVNTAVGRGWEWRVNEKDGHELIQLHHPCMQDEVAQVTPEKCAEYEPVTILKDAKNGRDVSRMTRVVGYYSKTENWNASKHGELKDRHEGDYAV